jgi:hypothetical protein
MKEKPNTRRKFLKSAAVGSLAVMAMPTLIPSRAFGANDRVRVSRHWF